MNIIVITAPRPGKMYDAKSVTGENRYPVILTDARDFHVLPRALSVEFHVQSIGKKQKEMRQITKSTGDDTRFLV